MVVIHMALFHWKKGISQEHINKVLRKVKKVKNRINGIIDIMCGEN